MLNPILIIIALNLGFFLAVQISPGLVYDLGLWSPTEVFFKHPWGLVTSMFVHEEFFHFFANMITLFFFGSYLNRLIGSRKLLLVYFGGGILGSIFFILLTPSFSLPAVGASGAVFALGGAMAVVVPRLRVFIFPIPAPIPLWIAVIGGFVILSFLPYVAWEAHLGGLVLGLVAGYIFRGKRHYYH